jgi:hypothetical protein
VLPLLATANREPSVFGAGTGTGGIYRFTLTAHSAIGSADQTFGLTVFELPAFISRSRATFRVGASRTFEIRTRGFPRPELSERGRLPRGLKLRFLGNGRAVITGEPSRAARGKTYLLLLAANDRGYVVRQKLYLHVK